MKNRRNSIRMVSCFFVVLLFPVLSCDILRHGAFEVAGWSPGEGYRDPASVQVALDFTLDPDRNSVEKSFSLTEDGTALGGHFSWRGSRMIFDPASPLVQNRDYHITLKTGAQDTKGLSLERQFEAVFSTRNGKARPVLIASVPGEGGILAGERDPVELVFSGAMNRSSLQNLSFSPAVSGVWSLKDDGERAVFTPAENWITGRSYRLTAAPGIQNDLELEAGRPYVLHFSAGLDRTRPELLSAFAIDAEGNTAFVLTAEGTAAAENAGWERTYRLVLQFSKPVETASVNSALSMEPSLGMDLETPPGYEETLVYRFSAAPAWNGAYTITLNQAVKDGAGSTLEKRIRWRIRADGPRSKPPVLKGLRIPKVPGSGTELLQYTPENFFAAFPLEGEHYTFDTGIAAWMELYFETAAGASIDPFSLMEKFRFSSTNGAISFSPRLIILSGFTQPAAAPGWETYCRAEIRGVMTNHPYTGMVTIEVGADLKDSQGNKSAGAQRFLLLK